jgi:Flp pilus assembly protein TadG
LYLYQIDHCGRNDMLAKLFRLVCKKVKTLLGEEDGLAMVFVAAGMLALLGMTALVVDTGILALEKRRLQNACDAAALAAAQELYYTGDESSTRQKAVEYLENNNINETPAITVDMSTKMVGVSSACNKDLTFARVLGVNTGVVTAGAKAVFGTATIIDCSECACSPLVPFGVPDRAGGFQPGEEVMLKFGAGIPEIHGNFGGLALGGRGARNYGYNIRYGYKGVLSVGSLVTTEPGNMSRMTRGGIQYRLDQCPHTPKCTYDGGYHPDCPRVIIVPVYKPADLRGRDEVEIARFAAMLLEKSVGSGNECKVQGRFLSIAPPPGTKTIVEAAAPDDELPADGVRAARLIE